MKKLLLALFSVVAFSGMVNAQCTPDMSYAGDSGIHPDSATNFAVAYVGVPYSQTVTAVIPADTCVVIVTGFPCTTMSFDSVNVTSVTGLPPGYVFTCAVPNCSFPGNSINCAIITGTSQPGDEGTYNLTINLDAYVGGFTIPNSFTLDYYKIIVMPAQGVEDINSEFFEVSAIVPNPFEEVTQIRFTSGQGANVKLEVFNLIGQPVYSKSVNAVKGKNTVNFDGSELPTGSYILRLTDGKKAVTRKLVIAR